MSNFNRILFVIVFAGTLCLSHKYTKPKVVPAPPTPPVVTEPEPVVYGPYDITHQVPTKYLSYQEVVERLKEWHQEAPEITEVGVSGKVQSGKDVYYLRIGTPGKPKLLIHACIHGNERLATASTLGIMGKMLHDYKRDEQVTWLVENRDIYFVPVFSPDTYLRSRYVEGDDPNRRWPYPGSRADNQATPIKVMQDFFLKHKFVGAIDGHTTGRDFFWPSIARGDDADNFRRLAGEMADLANYSPSRISNSPSGYAIDWYYWKGAVSMLTEFGSGSHDQPIRAIEPEVQRTYKAYLHFIQEAPKIKLNPPKTAVKVPSSGRCRRGCRIGF